MPINTDFKNWDNPVHRSEANVGDTGDIPIRLSRSEVVDMLKDRLKLAKVFDREVVKRHKADEAAFVKEWKTRCIAASKWDMTTIRKQNFNAVNATRWRYASDATSGLVVPTCPTEVSPVIESLIRQIEVSNQKTFTLSKNGDGARLRALMLWDPYSPPSNPEAEVC